MPTLLIYYFAVKAIFLLGLIRSSIKFDTLLEYPTFLAVLYTGGVAFLSFMFQAVLWGQSFNQRAWGIWLAKTLVLAMIYFRLLRRFDEGALFLVVVLLAVPLLAF